MQHRTVVGIALMLTACGQSPTSAPEATQAREVTTADDDTCTGSVAEYCRTTAGVCPSFDTAVARRSALCAQPGVASVEVRSCAGSFRSVGWRYHLLGHGDEYFDDGGRLTAAYLASDYGAAYCGHSFTQRFGEVPECPGAVVTTSLCGP